MNEWIERFNNAIPRDLQFFGMRQVDYCGDPAVELMFVSPVGDPVVIRVSDGTVDWLKASMRDAANGWARSTED